MFTNYSVKCVNLATTTKMSGTTDINILQDNVKIPYLIFDIFLFIRIDSNQNGYSSLSWNITVGSELQ